DFRGSWLLMSEPNEIKGTNTKRAAKLAGSAAYIVEPTKRRTLDNHHPSSRGGARCAARHHDVDLRSCRDSDARNLNVHFGHGRHLDRRNYNAPGADGSGRHQSVFRIFFRGHLDGAGIMI